MTVHAYLFARAEKGHPEYSPLLPKVLEGTRQALQYFPELEDEFLTLHVCNDAAPSIAVFRRRNKEKRVCFNPRFLAIADAYEVSSASAHELSHLMQARGYGGYPEYGEEAADLIWLSRCGSAFPREPHYLPRDPRPIGIERWDLWATDAEELARQAWEQRSSGNRHYLRWWEVRLRALIKDGHHRLGDDFAGRYVRVKARETGQPMPCRPSPPLEAFG